MMKASVKRTIIVTGYSKSYGLAGLRIGSLGGAFNQTMLIIFRASLHQSTVHGVKTSRADCCNHCPKWMWTLVLFSISADACGIYVSELNASKGVSCIAPQGCYVAFVDITAIAGKTSAEIQAYLPETAKVAVVPVYHNGLKQEQGYIRLSFATSNGFPF